MISAGRIGGGGGGGGEEEEAEEEEEDGEGDGTLKAAIFPELITLKVYVVIYKL
jgi:hypothetical protein